MRIVWLLSLLHFAATVSLAAQELAPRFATWEPTISFAHAVPLAPVTREDTVDMPRGDYRFEGLAFGGITFGALGAWIGSRLGYACPTVPGVKCEPDRLGNAAVLGLAGAALGGTLGFLVGRFSPKQPRIARPASDSLLTSFRHDIRRKRTGYHHWEGLAIGSGAGALLGTLLALGARVSCADCDTDYLKAGLSSAAVAGAFGFLVGLGTPKYEPAPTKTLPE